MRYAKNYKCVNCGKRATVFFGLADPDAEDAPYCRKCVEIVKIDIYRRICSMKDGVY
jgi:hypothetical protein